VNPSTWPCPNIGKPRQRRHQRADAEVLVALPKLVDRGALVGIVHEVDVALENLRIELDGVLDDEPIVRVLLVAQHVHEGAVVHAMHAERANEVAFEQPEGFGQQQRAGSLSRKRSTTSRQNSLGMAASNSGLVSPYSARDGIAPPVPGAGYHSRW
jgi:hypothetical protein